MSNGSILTQVAALLILIAAAAILALRRHYRRREGSLERMLLRQRGREKARNGLLGMLIQNKPLEEVLEAVAQFVLQEARGGRSIILLKQPEGWRAGAAPQFPAEWMAALSGPDAVPACVWKEAGRALSSDPAWRTFSDGLASRAALSIQWYPVGGNELPLGAVLFFEEVPLGGAFVTAPRAEILQCAAWLSQLTLEHYRLYEDLEFHAHHDSLTGLPNGALFEDRLAQACREARASGQKPAVLMVDLDRFKQVNDTASHRAGDLFLSAVGERIRGAVRPADTVARVGGDEFGIVIAHVHSAEEAQEIGERILAEISEPLAVEGKAIACGASVGVAVYPGDGEDGDSLQRAAVSAASFARKSGGGRVKYFGAGDPGLNSARLERELHTALRDELFEVHYQPKIGADGRFCGLEALLRLDHPTLGRVSPADFIPVAEESGLIVPLGAWVLNEVCRQIAEWRAAGHGEVSVAVNVSCAQLMRPDFARETIACVRRHSLEPWNIELELTESLLINGGETSRRQMQELRALGIRFSIDDFGTGYSSLSYLHRLQVDAIKLDRSFVQSIDTDPAARRLVQAMIGVAEGLGLNVIAEGVETEAQRNTLADAGCPMMQGFLFSRPQKARDLETFLAISGSNPGYLERSGSMGRTGRKAAAANLLAA